MYEARGWWKEAEKDNFENGLTGERACFQGGEHFYGDTVEALVNDANDMFWCQYVTIEGDQIVLERMENGNGERVDKEDREWKAWEAGFGDLWVARFYLRVEEVVRKPVLLEPKEYEL